ncbi:heterokaryon incompatibility protein-domain-containing protein, partial [Cercophora newfieldiana]
QTMQHNLDERTSPFSLSALSQTLQDAVLLTRSLGIRYIWIDAICIVQDDRAEWMVEAQKMMQYYGDAQVTIVPAHADSADSGMKTEREVPFSRRFTGPWNNDSGRDLILTNTAFKTRDAVSKWAWNQRGWTYQERLNSARLLFVFSHSLMLNCRQGSWNSLTGWDHQPREAWSTFLPLRSPGKTQSRLDRDANTWCSLVGNYTQRQLTSRRDKWFAFSSIAEAFSRASGRRTVAGLLEDRLLEDLASWRSP